MSSASADSASADSEAVDSPFRAGVDRLLDPTVFVLVGVALAVVGNFLPDGTPTALVLGILGSTVFLVGVSGFTGSKLVTIAVFGIVVVVFGRFFLGGTISGMFGIWGVTFFLIGAVGLALFYTLYRPT